MGTRDPRIDAYIARSADFAQPILTHLRDLVHTACPRAGETIKWGHPHFEYKGILCGIAAFKEHCAFGFWRARVATEIVGKNRASEAMGQFGRITRLSDLPRDTVIKEAIRAAAAQNEAGVKEPRAKRSPRPELPVPDDLKAALAKNRKARLTFEAFSPTHRREYIEWIVGAKREETRTSRLATTLEWLAEGKQKEWRYQTPAKAR